jgi:effector-binding domain-containing protein
VAPIHISMLNSNIKWIHPDKILIACFQPDLCHQYYEKICIDLMSNHKLSITKIIILWKYTHLNKKSNYSLSIIKCYNHKSSPSEINKNKYIKSTHNYTSKKFKDYMTTILHYYDKLSKNITQKPS